MPSRGILEDREQKACYNIHAMRKSVYLTNQLTLF